MDDKLYNTLFSLSYEEILNIQDIKIKKFLLTEYKKEQTKLFNAYPNLINQFEPSKSLEYNYFKFDELENASLSEYLFPGNKVLYYPIIEEFKAKKEYICAISGAVIKPGSSYEQFKAFLYNVSQNSSYISTKIKYEVGSFTYPTTLHEFENFYYKLEFSYKLDLEEEYNIATNIGGLSLRYLKNKNKTKK